MGAYVIDVTDLTSETAVTPWRPQAKSRLRGDFLHIYMYVIGVIDFKSRVLFTITSMQVYRAIALLLISKCS